MVALVVTGFEHAALSRGRQPHESRRPFYLYVDEFQDFAAHPGQAKTFSRMLSQVRKHGLHMVLANQSIAQLPPDLQTAIGNAQTVVSFRVTRADAEALARILGRVDTEAVKRESQTDIQHPVYAPLIEQWEGLIQLLTRLRVRQAVVKTADDREAVIWPEKIKKPNCTHEQLETIISKLVATHGNDFKDVRKMLVEDRYVEQQNNGEPRVEESTVDFSQN